MNEKNDINDVYAYGNDTLPTVQRAFFPGKHENEQQEACQNHHADVDVVCNAERQGVDDSAYTEDKEDIENIGTDHIADRNVNIFSVGGHGRGGQFRKGRAYRHHGQSHRGLA